MEGAEDRISVSDLSDLICIVESIDAEASLDGGTGHEIWILGGVNSYHSHPVSTG